MVTIIDGKLVGKDKNKEKAEGKLKKVVNSVKKAVSKKTDAEDEE